MKLSLSTNQISPNGYYCDPIDYDITHGAAQVQLFSVNGFELCPLEKHYQQANKDYSDYDNATKLDWILQDPTVSGVVLNHSFLLWRKGYRHEAAKQLQQWAQQYPVYHRLLQIRPKWAVDFAIEYVDARGVMFEILHFEYDFFDYDQYEELKCRYESVFLNADWHDWAQRVYRKRHEWEHLEFFEQSKWKCLFFGIEPENFGQTIWHLV
jgi:hypothetical protein